MTANFAESNDTYLISEILYHRRDGLVFLLPAFGPECLTTGEVGKRYRINFFVVNQQQTEKTTFSVNSIKTPAVGLNEYL